MVAIEEAKSELNLLFAGTLFVVLALVYTRIGKAWTRSSWVLRSKEPKWFWWQIALYSVGGVVLIGLALFSN